MARGKVGLAYCRVERVHGSTGGDGVLAPVKAIEHGVRVVLVFDPFLWLVFGVFFEGTVQAEETDMCKGQTLAIYSSARYSGILRGLHLQHNPSLRSLGSGKN